MKKLLTLLTCFLMITSFSYAQKDSSRYAKEKTRVRNMDSTRKQNYRDKGVTKNNMKDLNLSKDQEKQMDDIHTRSRQEKEKINNDNSLTPEQKQQKLQAIDKEEKSKMHTVLTPEQRQKMKAKRASQKKKDNG